jgi:hypothetical protein
MGGSEWELDDLFRYYYPPDPIPLHNARALMIVMVCILLAAGCMWYRVKPSHDYN